jgi:hypothetical protein
MLGSFGIKELIASLGLGNVDPARKNRTPSIKVEQP